VKPAGFLDPFGGHKKRTRHSGILTLLDSSRIETLQQLLAQSPANTFVRYGLAMEFVKAGELDRAVGEFDTLLQTEPSYSAAYFHGGQTLEKLGRLDQARDFYRRGLAASNDAHARSELQAALDILGG
jgi:tetratricopeptide (TPR) repeat protein